MSLESGPKPGTPLGEIINTQNIIISGHAFESLMIRTRQGLVDASTNIRKRLAEALLIEPPQSRVKHNGTILYSGGLGTSST